MTEITNHRPGLQEDFTTEAIIMPTPLNITSRSRQVALRRVAHISRPEGASVTRPCATLAAV